MSPAALAESMLWHLRTHGPLTAEQVQDKLRHDVNLSREQRHTRYALVVRILRELVADGKLVADTSRPATRYGVRADRRAS